MDWYLWFFQRLIYQTINEGHDRGFVEHDSVVIVVDQGHVDGHVTKTNVGFTVFARFRQFDDLRCILKLKKEVEKQQQFYQKF